MRQWVKPLSLAKVNDFSTSSIDNVGAETIIHTSVCRLSALKNFKKSGGNCQQPRPFLLTLKAQTSFSIRVRTHERQNELITAWDFKPAWKQGLVTWSFISAAFQNDPIFWWTCVDISFRVVFAWYFINRNEISFLSKWTKWNPYMQWVSNKHAH